MFEFEPRTDINMQNELLQKKDINETLRFIFSKESCAWSSFHLFNLSNYACLIFV